MNVLLASYMGRGSLSGVRTYYELLLQHADAYKIKMALITPNDCSRIVHYGTSVLRRVLVGTVYGSKVNRIFVENLVCWLRLHSAIKRVSTPPDLVHAQDPGSASVAARIFRGSIPVITTCHFNDDPTDEVLQDAHIDRENARLLRKWHAFTLRHTRNWIAVSEYGAKELLHLVPSNSTIDVIYNGINFKSLSHLKPDEMLRRQYFGKLLVLNVGALTPRKNQKLLLNIASFLREKQIVFLVVGDGPDRPFLDQEIKRLYLENNVKLMGRRGDISSLMNSCDLYLHTALNENCPFVLLEAMAAGLPVMAAASGGTPELFEGRENIFNLSETAEAIAQKIAFWADNADLRIHVAAKQRQYAKEKFNLDQMINKTVVVYRNNCRNKNNP